MTVQNLSAQPPFITKDGSTIRSILDRTNAPVQNQSLAEARVPAGARTERHYHKNAKELYFILDGTGEIELDSEHRTVRPGDPHPRGRVAHDRGYRSVALSLLLRAALFARGYVRRVTGKATGSADISRKDVAKDATVTTHPFPMPSCRGDRQTETRRYSF